jgi:abortive infection bacteriophage resistance protein
MSTTFQKPSITVQEQLDFLAQQGLIITDQQEANHVLSMIGYYRFSGYLLPYKQNHSSTGPRLFIANTKFENIWQLYRFDQELRALLSCATEKIEVAFRAALVNTTSTELSPFWYADKTFHRQQRTFEGFMKHVNQVLDMSHDIFIKHYVDKYDSPKYPPIWMIIETLSFGTCSKLFNNITSVALRKKIAKQFDQHPTILSSWIHSLTFTRNICAHHARLWNRWLVNSPMIPKHEPLRDDFLTTKEYRFHLIAYVVQKLLKVIDPEFNWQKSLYDLFDRYPSYPGIEMGFQKDWQNDPFWKL